VEHGQEFGRLGVALVVRQEDAVAGEFLGIAARDQIDQKSTVADAVDRRRLAGKVGRRTDARSERGEEAQPLRYAAPAPPR
jgi:hypothetical protein